MKAAAHCWVRAVGPRPTTLTAKAVPRIRTCSYSTQNPIIDAMGHSYGRIIAALAHLPPDIVAERLNFILHCILKESKNASSSSKVTPPHMWDRSNGQLWMYTDFIPQDVRQEIANIRLCAMRNPAEANLLFSTSTEKCIVDDLQNALFVRNNLQAAPPPSPEINIVTVSHDDDAAQSLNSHFKAPVFDKVVFNLEQDSCQLFFSNPQSMQRIKKEKPSWEIVEAYVPPMLLLDSPSKERLVAALKAKTSPTEPIIDLLNAFLGKEQPVEGLDTSTGQPRLYRIVLKNNADVSDVVAKLKALSPSVQIATKLREYRPYAIAPISDVADIIAGATNTRTNSVLR